jgi:hypothetical protein
MPVEKTASRGLAYWHCTEFRQNVSTHNALNAFGALASAPPIILYIVGERTGDRILSGYLFRSARRYPTTRWVKVAPRVSVRVGL